jgi:hypothetical protein
VRDSAPALPEQAGRRGLALARASSSSGSQASSSAGVVGRTRWPSFYRSLEPIAALDPLVPLGGLPRATPELGPDEEMHAPLRLVGA